MLPDTRTQSPFPESNDETGTNNALLSHGKSEKYDERKSYLSNIEAGAEDRLLDDAE